MGALGAIGDGASMAISVMSDKGADSIVERIKEGRFRRKVIEHLEKNDLLDGTVQDREALVVLLDNVDFWQYLAQPKDSISSTLRHKFEQVGVRGSPEEQDRLRQGVEAAFFYATIKTGTAVEKQTALSQARTDEALLQIVNQGLDVFESLEEIKKMIESSNQAQDETLVDLAKSIRTLRSTTETLRVVPTEIWTERSATIRSRDQRREIWNAETGERLALTRLPRLEEEGFRNRIRESLRDGQSTVSDHADRVRSSAAGVQAAHEAVPTAAIDWLERTLDELVDQAGRWEIDPALDPAEPVTRCLSELDKVLEAIKSLVAGDHGIVIPLVPEPVEPPPDPLGDLIAICAPVSDSAARFVRVDHLPYDADLHGQILAIAPALADLPNSWHFMKLGLTLSQSSVFGAAIVRNASMEQFETVIGQVTSLRPFAAAAAHLERLSYDSHQLENEQRVTLVGEAISSIAAQVVNEVRNASFWAQNSWHGLEILFLAVDGAGQGAVSQALRNAVRDNDLIPDLLRACSSVSDSMHSETGQYLSTKRSYQARLPEWFPVDSLREPVRELVSTEDLELKQLAEQFLAVHS